MSNVLRCYFRQKKPSFNQFLTHCIVRRALRKVPEMKLSFPPVVGIVSGQKASVDEIDEALTLLRLPDLRGLRDRFSNAVTVVLECEPVGAGRYRQRERTDDSFLVALQGKKAIFAVAKAEEDLPDLLRKIADAIIYLEGPTPRQIQAAFDYCVGIDISIQEAEHLTSYSLLDLSLAASRGKSWRRVLDAISSDDSKCNRSQSGDMFSLESLAGLGEAGDWGRELAADLKDWSAGELPWSEVNRGVLVAGPPGTGKTTYAKALARSCGIELVATSLAQWQAAGHLGDLLKAMRRTFSDARKKAPCILFLDEFDSVGDRGTVRGDNALYVVEKINGLLECLDGVEGREGIVVIAACNHPELIDPAFLRPGRLEQTIYIPLPDRSACEQILRWHLKGALADDCLSDIAGRLEGFSGADIEKFVRDARRAARKEKRHLKFGDLASRLPKQFAFRQEDLRRIAVHEAGHAILQAKVGDGEIVRLRIEPKLSESKARREAGALEVLSSTLKARTRSDYEAQLMVHLAGLAAEELILGEIADGGGGSIGSDLASATKVATEMEASFGFGGNLLHLVSSGSRQVREILLTDHALRRRVENTLVTAYEDARAVLEENVSAHHALADALMQKHKLEGREVLEIISANGQDLQKAV
ncbi:AAA family ATPase [Roseibium sp. CAU 1637]|uniref:AAA family ATPase n=1 Tax=Roseibium limicola TaxID=2816037 RepID=A0A939EJV0_9HYPH|nr:AAA family ATPase [Roseibium limicola]MBO0343904.1 AAA family ATPase [Roseibium limicola]